MGLIDKVVETRLGVRPEEQRFNLSQYPQFVSDWYSSFGYAGSLYPLQQTVNTWQKTEEISSTLPAYMTSLRKSPPAFAAQLVRASVMSQARLTWRNRTDRHVFRNNDLRVLERPWVNGTTGELLSRMEWSAGLAGNAYVYRQPNRLRVLRPDWVAIVYGSQSEPDDPKGALDGEVVGYAYKNGGFTAHNKNAMTVILPEQMAHWTPLPDPMSPGLGMSWLTPALRDLQSDQAAEEYKLGYFTNGATPNLVVKASSLAPNITPAQFKEWVDTMEQTHKGSANAFKTLYLQPGADATVIGSNLQQLDLTSITSHGETRISYLSRVPAVILGIAAGLKGSSLNAGNYGEARRNFADSWYYSTLQDACAALNSIVTTPGGAELWYDVADVPLLREDAADAAKIQETLASTIVSLVNGGFKPESVKAAVIGQNMSLLEHDDRFTSVQLQSLVNASPNQPEPPEPVPADIAPQQASRGNEVTDALIGALTRELPAPVVHNNITVEPSPPAEVSIPITVQPAEVRLEQPITVQPAAPAEVSIPVTVEPAQVRVEAPITVEAAEPAQITNEFAAPNVTVEAPITVEQPEIEINLPSAKPRTKKIRVRRADGSEASATIEEAD